MNCPYCQNIIPDASTQCPACGQQLNAQQPGAYNQQPGAYNQQPGAYNQQPGAYNQQPGMYNQQPGGFYQQASPSGMLIANFANDAKNLKVRGIIAAVLMFGIGIFFSISIWVSKVSAPQVAPANDFEFQTLEKANKDLKLAKTLSFLPLIAIALSFVIGFIGGFVGAL